MKTKLFSVFLTFIFCSTLYLPTSVAQDYTTFAGHRDWVKSVGFSPNGSQIISGGWDHTVRIWDAETGAMIRTFTSAFRRYIGRVSSVGFSPDGSQIVSGSDDGGGIWDRRVRVWDAETGAVIRTLTGHTAAVYSVSFSPDGSQIVSGSWDHTVRVWDAETGAMIHTLTGHTDWVYSVSFSPDGSQIVSGGLDDTVRIWDAETGAMIRILTGHTRAVTSVSFSPDGSQIVSGGSDSRVRVWDAETGAVIHTLTGHTSQVSSVGFSPDGSQIVSGGGRTYGISWVLPEVLPGMRAPPPDYTVRVWDAETGAVIRTLTGHTNSVTSVSFSPDGSQIVSGSDDYTVLLWDLAPAAMTGQQRTIDQEPAVTSQAGTAESIEIEGSRTLDGTLAEASRLRVRVVDANDNSVSGVGVTFRVLSPGQGMFAGARGTGRAIRIDTDRNGYASTNFTPTRATSLGTVTVEAKAAGVDATVTFIIDVGDNTPPPETPSTETPTPSDTRETAPATVTVEPLVAATNRPVLYWIVDGALYRLAGGSEATQIAQSAIDIAVDVTGGKLYWIEQTSERTGAVHRANLDGTQAEVVKTLTSAPQGLAIDVDFQKLYLTNGWGKIQQMNTDGTNFRTNFITGLKDPMHVATLEGGVFWTQKDGSVWLGGVHVDTNEKTLFPLATNTGPLGGIVATAEKVYWTEQTGPRSGKVRASNVTTVQDVYTVTSTVHALTIDSANNQLYWTNGWGKIQRGHPGGSSQDVVRGLTSAPTVLAIGMAKAADAPSIPKTETTTTTAQSSKYDVNGDGRVDNVDVGIVSDALFGGNPPANPGKLDVNGDGTLDIQDLIAVSQNVEDWGAAGAPARPAKLTHGQINRIQEQIDLLLTMDEGSIGVRRTLVYLQSLLATARPEETLLLANYPNPFNPETWIPYQLSKDADVTLTIYAIDGQMIRRLALGHQPAGIYQSRSRAAYWDGKNALGEPVASSVYFYTLTAGDFTATRKMLIRK